MKLRSLNYLYLLYAFSIHGDSCTQIQIDDDMRASHHHCKPSFCLNKCFKNLCIQKLLKVKGKGTFAKELIIGNQDTVRQCAPIFTVNGDAFIEGNLIVDGSIDGSIKGGLPVYGCNRGNWHYRIARPIRISGSYRYYRHFGSCGDNRIYRHNGIYRYKVALLVIMALLEVPASPAQPGYWQHRSNRLYRYYRSCRSNGHYRRKWPNWPFSYRINRGSGAAGATRATGFTGPTGNTGTTRLSS